MSDQYTLNEIERQVEGLREAHPELWENEDERLLADMLEGCTTFNELMTRIAKRIKHAKGMVKHQTELLAELRKRHDRYEAKHEALRALALKALEIANLPGRKLELPLATLSIKRGPPKVIVTDMSALPAHCQRITIEPNRLVIKDRILHGETVPGAELSNGEDTLSIT